jgi:hypothetical protein
MCDFLVGKIEEIEAEVENMFEGWRSVEDGGKSLKDACQRLLEERVSETIARVSTPY